MLPTNQDWLGISRLHKANILNQSPLTMASQPGIGGELRIGHECSRTFIEHGFVAIIESFGIKSCLPPILCRTKPNLGIARQSIA